MRAVPGPSEQQFIRRWKRARFGGVPRRCVREGEGGAGMDRPTGYSVEPIVAVNDSFRMVGVTLGHDGSMGAGGRPGYAAAVPISNAETMGWLRSLVCVGTAS